MNDVELCADRFVVELADQLYLPIVRHYHPQYYCFGLGSRVVVALRHVPVVL